MGPKVTMQRNGRYDVFVDLVTTTNTSRSLNSFLDHLQTEEGQWAEDCCVTLALPPQEPNVLSCDWANCFDDPVAGLAAALDGAAAKNRALVVIIGTWTYSNTSTSALLDYSDYDPMIGTIQPRFAKDDAERIHGLPSGSGGISLSACSRFLPEYYVTLELLSVFFLITPRGVLAAPKLAPSSLEDAYGTLLRGLRRRGFRNLLCNHNAVATGLPSDEIYLPLKKDLSAGAEQPVNWLRDVPEEKLEAILSSAFTKDGRARLLLDCRGIIPSYNGTSACILGFLRGFQVLNDTRFAITVLISKDAAEFHNLTETFAGFEIISDPAPHTFVAAILMAQPWSLSTIRELNQVASLVMFNMLDTIAWDIAYVAPQDLGETWRILGLTADAIFFNSAYSRDLYSFRFHPDPRIPCVVTQHSTTPKEILRGRSEGTHGAEPFLFLVGNSYAHKDIIATLDTLSKAFPYTEIRVLGAGDYKAHNVTSMSSGNLSAATMTSLYAGAAAIIFPSFYEGFGLPVVEALAYEKTVIVRDSPLWDEIAQLSYRSELIVPFRTEADLVEAVGRALHGEPQKTLENLPESEARSEPSWADCANKMLETTSRLVAEFDSRHWLARQILLEEAMRDEVNRVERQLAEVGEQQEQLEREISLIRTENSEMLETIAQLQTRSDKLRRIEKANIFMLLGRSIEAEMRFRDKIRTLKQRLKKKRGLSKK
ncbi:MAG: hypothetical protein COA78_00840 [Blastopirellula sp.]|nr:MAG: hypothetical protein COA78_00840 [Blastopirellula sp.]